MDLNIDLAKLPENLFTKEYLVPLFKKMGFRDVEYYGGGANEKGKDIVMWNLNTVPEKALR